MTAKETQVPADKIPVSLAERDFIVRAVEYDNGASEIVLRLGPVGPFNADRVTLLGALIGAPLYVDLPEDFVQAITEARPTEVRFQVFRRR